MSDVLSSKNDLTQIMRNMADKHRGVLGITHVPIPLGMLDQICEALQVETEAPRDTMYTLKLQCQALWRTDITLVCCLPKGHDGNHKARNGWTFTGECVMSPETASVRSTEGTCTCPPPLDPRDCMATTCPRAIAARGAVKAAARLCPKCDRTVTEGCDYVACPYPLPMKTSGVRCTQCNAQLSADGIVLHEIGCPTTL